MMKKTFTKLFVAFLALLLAPNVSWAQSSFTFGSTTTEAQCQEQFGNLTDLDTNGDITTLSFNANYDGSGLDLVINSALEINIAEGLTVNLQSLTCNGVAVTVYGGGILNVSNGSGHAVTINAGLSAEGSFTIGKVGQAPMNVNLTSNEGACLYFDGNFFAPAFIVIDSNVELSGPLANIDDFEEGEEVSYVNCELKITGEESATITANSSAAPAATYYFSFGSLESLTAVTSANVDEVLENSGLSYDADNNMLTISGGAEIEAICTGNPTGTEVNDGLTINVAGDASVTEIDIYADAIITGDGMLTMGSNVGTGANGAIVFKKNADLNFANANITIYKSGATGEYGIYYVDGVQTMDLTFDNSNVTISSFNVNEDEVGYAIYGLSEPILSDCSITAPTGAAWVHDTYDDADDYYYTTGDDEENWWGNRVYNLTIMRDSEIPATDEVGDVFYTETEIGDGVLSIPYTVLTLADGDTPGEVMLGVDPYGDDHAATYTGSGQIDFEIPESVTSPNGSTYNVTVGNTISTDFFNPITFIKTLTIPATLTEFVDEFLGYIAAPIKDLEKPGLEKVIFADGSVQDAITTGDIGTAFMTGFVLDDDWNTLETDAVELVIPDDWDDVLPDWGGGKWVGDNIISLVHYEIWFNQYGATEEGIEVTSLNKEDVLGDGGSITYDPDSKELTITTETTDIANILNGNTGFVDMRPGVDGLKIVIPEGKEVTISMDGMEGMDPAITVYNNTIITGGGTLNVKHRINDVIQIGGTHQGEAVTGSLTVKDVTMNVYAIGSTAQAIRFANAESSLVVNSATLHLECQDGGNEGPAEDVVMYGLAGNEPTFINCSITTPTTPPTWASLTGYWNTNVTNEAYRVYGYQVQELTIEPGNAFVADIKDGSYDGVTVELEQVGETDKVTISGVATGDDATGAVVIPATVTVGDASFTVTSIGENAFEGETNLTGVTLPQTLTSIGAEAFKSCGTISEVTFLGAVPTIANDAFDATSVTNVNYPAAAKSDATTTKLAAVGATTTSPCVFTSTEWTTLYSGVDFELPDDVEAYIVTNVDFTTGKLTVAPTGGKVKANTALLLRKQPAGDDMYPITSFADIDISGAGTPCSEFKGSTEPVNIVNNAAKQYYILVNGQFVRAADGVLPAYKCYILNELPLGAPALSIVIQDGETTGISDVRGNTDDVTGEWYDLSGRRLQSKPTQKGVYIMNGKKIRVK